MTPVAKKIATYGCWTDETGPVAVDVDDAVRAATGGLVLTTRRATLRIALPMSMRRSA